MPSFLFKVSLDSPQVAYNAPCFQHKRKNLKRKVKALQSETRYCRNDGVVGSWNCRNESTNVTVIEKGEFTGFSSVKQGENVSSSV